MNHFNWFVVELDLKNHKIGLSDGILGVAARLSDAKLVLYSQ